MLYRGWMVAQVVCDAILKEKWQDQGEMARNIF